MSPDHFAFLFHTCFNQVSNLEGKKQKSLGVTLKTFLCVYYLLLNVRYGWKVDKVELEDRMEGLKSWITQLYGTYNGVR